MGYSRRLTDHVETRSEITKKVIKTWIVELLSLLFVYSGLLLIHSLKVLEGKDFIVACLVASALFAVSRTFTKFERLQLKFISDLEQQNVHENVCGFKAANKFFHKVEKRNRNLTRREAQVLYELSDKLVK
ncbi:hypothetical protein [Vibrio sp. D431a]|uniref:hypothetical protein n=1 Tax=Vibrio sp. D431a TaxID=2837388 RepID=UPI002553AD28|nr:hypothetical protein [Vibrio sp. D431a]MDK9789912.1 hypothetical protein [Vibrio sp. D431a]